MIKPPLKWAYTLIELEIDGKVIDNRIAPLAHFDRMYNDLLRQGQTQRLPWAIFISKSNYQKPRKYYNNYWQKRDNKGRFLKTQKETLLSTLNNNKW